MTSRTASPDADRVFLDANVLFSAGYRPDAGLVRLWKLRRTVLVTSDDARRNLGDPAQRTRLEELLEGAELVEGTFDGVPLPRRVTLPLDDLAILRAALASRCTDLLTGNLRDFGRYLGERIGSVLVVRPADYLAVRRR
jgi:uncharacterized protein